jgi:DNA-binding NarL/FixJ family response regulator
LTTIAARHFSRFGFSLLSCGAASRLGFEKPGEINLEPMLALCLSEVVEDEGCVVAGMAETVADARSLVATATFDVAIIDLHLRGEQADDLAASIIRSGHAIITSTGSDASKIPAEFHEWPILRKPYTDAAMVSAIKAAAATRSLPARATS